MRKNVDNSDSNNNKSKTRSLVLRGKNVDNSDNDNKRVKQLILFYALSIAKNMTQVHA